MSQSHRLRPRSSTKRGRVIGFAPSACMLTMIVVHLAMTAALIASKNTTGIW